MSTEQDLRHPPAPALEAVAAGDAGEESGPVAAHLEACAACATYVARLKGEAEAFRAGADPGAFAETIRKRAAARGAPGTTRLVWFVGPVVAAAAAAVLWLRAPPGVDPISTPLAPSVPASSSAPSSDLARFKGGLSVAVIRDRGGRQERLTGPFEVEPSDRLRIEIAVDREEPVTAGPALGRRNVDPASFNRRSPLEPRDALLGSLGALRRRPRGRDAPRRRARGGRPGAKGSNLRGPRGLAREERARETAG